MNATQLYWIMKLDDVCDALNVVCAFLLAMFLIFLTAYLVFIFASHAEDKPHNCEKILRILKTICIILIFPTIVVGSAVTFLPTTRQAAVMIVVPKAVQNKKIKEIPNKLIDIANDWFDSKIQNSTNGAGSEK